MSTLGEIYGGRVRKRPSKKQLLALARGRAKLRALRALGKRRRRHYKGGAVTSDDVSLDDFKTGGKMKKQKRCACGLCWLRKHKIILTLIAAAILVIISLRSPEYAENVAQAFVLLLAGV